MFDQIKDLYNLRKQAQEMEKQLVSERVEAQSDNGLISLVINGKHDLLEVKIEDRENYDKKELAQSFKQAHALAATKLQKILVEKFKGMM